MKAKYLINKETLKYLKFLYRQVQADHPDCQLGFGWGGSSTGWTGVNCAIYHDRSQPMPPIYMYGDVSVHLAFPSNIPEALKSGVICFRNNQFEILPVDEFKPEELVEGILEPSSEN